MASTFRRKQSDQTSSKVLPTSTVTTGLDGTKPWTGGITLTSTGLRDLDNILSGGQPLGTAILLQEDRWTRLGQCLIQYWCAEALSQGQHLLIPNDKDESMRNATQFEATLSWQDGIDDDVSSTHTQSSRQAVTKLLSSLPKNLHREKWGQQQDGAPATQAGLDTLQEEEDEEGDGQEENKAEESLKIAWQYRKSVQRERSGLQRGAQKSNSHGTASSVFCHSYDLSYEWSKTDSIVPTDAAHAVSMDAGGAVEDGRARGVWHYQQLLKHVDQHLSPSKPNKLVRLLLYHQDVRLLAVSLPLLLTHIRMHELPVVVMVATQTWTTRASSSLRVLRRTCDVVLETEGFAARQQYPPPPEFRQFQGLLKIDKIAASASANGNGGGHFADWTMSKRPAAFLYGLKRDRRKLHIQLLHIPPEEYAEGGGSVGGGGVRAGAGRIASTSTTSGCGGGSGSSQLDF